jgi:lipoyl-dependent peroxiredoxin
MPRSGSARASLLLAWSVRDDAFATLSVLALLVHVLASGLVCDLLFRGLLFRGLLLVLHDRENAGNAPKQRRARSSGGVLHALVTSMGISSASATWNGTLQDGRGDMKPEHGPDMPFSRPTRFEGTGGANPEELIGAALAGCFSMALSSHLEKAGMKPEHIRTTAKVHLDRVGGDFEIRQIDLDNETRASGGDEATFRMIAEETTRACPVGKVLVGTSIVLQTKLLRAKDH